MNISLTSELEKYVQEKVSSGLYTSASEVIRESLRLMHTHDTLQQQRIQQLNQSINLGFHELTSGNIVDAEKSYQRLKNKIENINQDEE
ncbi:MAG: type II toxin-antitoxin system ParD family antitoxin [Legionellales bacterium]|nr:type II toxin-antitoxin system ParD family antitoxin [Legionellales bacterium]|tara:strand:+ start:1379 stop:1645 length:267 start_codon:yes stop_codon:yes gene_type:complete